jgi:hypothetical protein
MYLGDRLGHLTRSTLVPTFTLTAAAAPTVLLDTPLV